MSRYYTVTTGADPHTLALDDGDHLGGWMIVDTVRGDTTATIELPSNWDPTRVEVEMGRLESVGAIVRSGGVLYTREPDDYTYGLDRG